jgi:hypothetical protein
MTKEVILYGGNVNKTEIKWGVKRKTAIFWGFCHVKFNSHMFKASEVQL